MDSPNAQLASIIQELMTERGISIAALSKASDVRYATLHRNLNRPDEYPFTVSAAWRVAEALGTTGTEVFAQVKAAA